MVLELCLELAQPVKHPGKRRSQQVISGNLGTHALKLWGVGIACPAPGGSAAPAAVHRTQLGCRVFPKPSSEMKKFEMEE